MSVKSHHIYYTNRFLTSPLEAVFTLLIFILNKELNVSPLQLTILAGIKPFVSIFVFYLNAFAARAVQKSTFYLAALNVSGCVLCLLFPFVDNAWYFIISYMIFITSLRTSYPVWMEIFKDQTGIKKMGRYIAKGASINCGLMIFTPLLVSAWMDYNHQIWRWVFAFLGLLQLSNTLLLFLARLPSANLKNMGSKSSKSLIEPLKEGWGLCKANPAFTHYLLMFFLGGAGLVALQPVLPSFFNDVLHLSYLELTTAISVLRGLFFMAASPFWGKWNHGLYALNGYINILSCLFIICMLISSANMNWLFVGYAFYGCMQAGCELSFNLSGPFFSKEEKSLAYSGLNFAFLGIRACIFPALGQLMYIYSNVYAVLWFAGILCFLSAIYAFYLDKHNITCKEEFGT